MPPHTSLRKAKSYSKIPTNSITLGYSELLRLTTEITVLSALHYRLHACVRELGLNKDKISFIYTYKMNVCLHVCTNVCTQKKTILVSSNLLRNENFSGVTTLQTALNNTVRVFIYYLTRFILILHPCLLILRSIE